MQVAPGVFAIRAVGSMVYLLGGAELSLVDAGGPGSAPRIVRYIRSLERQPRDLACILLTHVDMDHVGGILDLVAATGARICAHPDALRRLETGQIPRGERGLRSTLVALRRLFVRSTRLELAAEPLDDGALLPTLGGLQVIHTGGHSLEHTVFFARQSRLLFSGDLLRVSRGHLEAVPGPTPNRRQEMVAALRRLADLDPLAVLPGHGPAYRNNIALRLIRLAEILE